MDILDQMANAMFENLPLARWSEHSDGFKVKRRARAKRALELLADYFEARSISHVATAVDIRQIIDEFSGAPTP